MTANHVRRLTYIKNRTFFRKKLKIKPKKFGGYEKSAYLCIRFRAKNRLRGHKGSVLWKYLHKTDNSSTRSETATNFLVQEVGSPKGLPVVVSGNITNRHPYIYYKEISFYYRIWAFWDRDKFEGRIYKFPRSERRESLLSFPSDDGSCIIFLSQK